jgi:ribosomal protein L29
MAVLKKKTAVKTVKATKEANEVKTEAQLQEELLTLRAAHLESRKSHRSGELVNPHVLTVQRKSIARILTAINQVQKTAVKEAN